MFLLLSADDADELATPFEQWCESMDLNPEDPRAWPLYEASVGQTDHAPAAS